MARTQKHTWDIRTRIRKAEAALRREVALGDHVGRMTVLRDTARHLLRARLCALKECIQSARRGMGYYQLHPPEDETPSSHFTRFHAERKKLINGGEDAILVEYGVPVFVSSRHGGGEALLTSATCSACEASLVYFDPLQHGIDREQLGCTSCGAMFEIDVIDACHLPMLPQQTATTTA